MMKVRNRLANISDSRFDDFIAFARENPDIVDFGQMLEKLVIFDFVSPIVTERPCADILEIGCGQGIHSCLLTEYGKVSATDMAVTESWMGAAGAIRERVFRTLAKSRVDFMYNDGRSLPYEDNSFDIVFHNSVIEHVPDVIAFNREVARVLRPGGSAICITGTTMLCLFRLLRYYLMRQPLLFGYNIMRTWNVPKRLRALIPFEADIDAEMGRDLDLGPLFPGIFHFIRQPAYNRIVIENMAGNHGVSFETMLELLARRFERSFSQRVLLAALPATHGQHYRGAFHEAREWRLNRWREGFEAAGFSVEKMSGYRLQQILETTPSHVVNALLFHRFASLIHSLNSSGKLPPSMATEFILVARKQIE